MKKYILSFCILCGLFTTAYSQDFSYGLKAGVNYTMGGPITGIDSGEGYFAETVEASGSVGFHGGVFLEIGFNRFFVRPEVVYATLETEYDFPIQPSTYAVERFSMPLLVGYNAYGPLDIYAGPVYSNVMNATLEGEEFLNPIIVQNSPINAQVGAKVEFGRFGLDIRYEHSLSTAEELSLDIENADYGINKATFNDARLNQIIVSIIFKIGGPGLNFRNNRPCY